DVVPDCNDQPHVLGADSGRSGARGIAASKAWYSRKKDDAAKYPTFAKAAHRSPLCIPAEVDLEGICGAA
ncbi:hypothetical protein L209DRAFT_682902, partial [Thermothelomyces heterothallicus CBS 203.75]